MSEEREPTSDFSARDRWLIFAFVLAATSWLCHLTVSFALTPEACADGTKAMLHWMTVLCAAGTITSGAIAYRVRRTTLGALGETRTTFDFLTLFVLATAVTLTAIILAQEVPNLLLRSCE